MNTRIPPAYSVRAQSLVGALLCLITAACGSTGTDQQPRVGADDSRGAAGQDSGASGGASGSKATGGVGNASGASGGAGAKSGADASGGSNAGSGAFSGTGGKGSSIEFGYCPGEKDSGYLPCATEADCSSPTPLCRDEPYSGAGRCGACRLPPHPCTDDTSCGGEVCVPFTDPCACSPTQGQCSSACTATSCASDEQCSSTGHCVAKSCTSDWTCQPGYRCAAAVTTGTDKHGCEPVPCASGYACPSGSTCSTDASVARDPHGCAAIHCGQPGAAACPVNTDCVTNAQGSGCITRKCKTSNDCDCGTCRSGTCANRPGVCLPPPPV